MVLVTDSECEAFEFEQLEAVALDCLPPVLSRRYGIERVFFFSFSPKAPETCPAWSSEPKFQEALDRGYDRDWQIVQVMHALDTDQSFSTELRQVWEDRLAANVSPEAYAYLQQESRTACARLMGNRFFPKFATSSLESVYKYSRGYGFKLRDFEAKGAFREVVKMIEQTNIHIIPIGRLKRNEKEYLLWKW